MSNHVRAQLLAEFAESDVISIVVLTCNPVHLFRQRVAKVVASTSERTKWMINSRLGPFQPLRSAAND